MFYSPPVFLPIKKFLVSFTLLTALFLISSCTIFNSKNIIFSEPFSRPVDLTKKSNKSEFLVKITESHNYDFELQFFFNDPKHSKTSRDEERVGRLVGGVFIENNKLVKYEGIARYIHLTIAKIKKNRSEQIIFNKIKEPGNSLISAQHYLQSIDSMELEPGVYKFSIESLKDYPDFVGTAIHFSIHRHIFK